MPKLEDCKNADGSTDWKKYNELQAEEMQARKDKGEICQRKGCNGFMLWPKGHPQTCDNCKNIDAPKELHHPGDVRCPKCGYHWRVGDGDDYEVYQEGTHDVTCPDCETEFEVTTWVSYTFVSPARHKEQEQSSES